MIIFPQKSGPTGVVAIFDIVYDTPDIYTASGDSSLTGPLSLAIDVTNNGLWSVYLGIELLTSEGAITVTDRTHIAFCPPSEHRTISGASVPQLAAIRGEITKITVHCYAIGPVSANSVSVLLRIGPAYAISAPQQMIGRDTLAFDPGAYYHNHLEAFTLVSGASVVEIMRLFIASGLLRIKLHDCYFLIPPTPSNPGCILLELRVNSVSVFRARSLAMEYTNPFVKLGYELNTFQPYNSITVQIIGSNSHTGLAYPVDVNFTHSYIY